MRYIKIPRENGFEQTTIIYTSFLLIYPMSLPPPAFTKAAVQ